MTEYSRTAKGSFVSTGGAQVINLPFTPDTISMWNYSSYATPAQHGIPEAYWDVSMGQGGGVVKLFNATPVLTTGVITSGGFSTFSAGKLLMFGPKVQIVTGAKSSAPTGGTAFTVAANPFSIGDVVQFEGLYQSPTTGMPQICGMPFVVIPDAFSSTVFSIDWNTYGSNYTSLTSSPTGAYVRKILYPFLYLPGLNFIAVIAANGTATQITTTTPHNYVAGQQVAFRIAPIWGTTQLNSLPNSNIPGSPKYYYVTSVVDQLNFLINVPYSSLTAFVNNPPVASVPGLDFPQVLAVGDVNSGGWPYTGGSLYPSPAFPTYPPSFPTINGPSIQGAFVNSTSQGFIIGAGSAVSDATSVLVGASTNLIYWEASLHDITMP